VNAGGLVRRALAGDIAETLRRANVVDVIAAGKAAAAMLTAFASETDAPIRHLLGVGPRTSASQSIPPNAAWCNAGHPLSDQGSVSGARRALDIATAAGENDLVVVLLSGGGSALMAMPALGISLEAKQRGHLRAQHRPQTPLRDQRWTTGGRLTRECVDLGSLGCRW
jgi:glycerate-2-kinase